MEVNIYVVGRYLECASPQVSTQFSLSVVKLQGTVRYISNKYTLLYERQWYAYNNIECGRYRTQSTYSTYSMYTAGPNRSAKLRAGQGKGKASQLRIDVGYVCICITLLTWVYMSSSSLSRQVPQREYLHTVCTPHTSSQSILRTSHASRQTSIKTPACVYL